MDGMFQREGDDGEKLSQEVRGTHPQSCRMKVRRRTGVNGIRENYKMFVIN